MSTHYRNPNKIRGVEARETVDKRRWLRDDATAGEEIHKALIQHELTPIFFSIAVFTALLMPGPWEIYAIICIIYGLLILSHYKRYPQMPHLLPHDAPVRYDIRLPKPGSGRRKFLAPAGEVYVGNDRETGKQIWYRFVDFLRHGIVYGGTGSGKSEFLLCLGFNFIAAGGSFLWADAKADVGTPHKLAWLCHRFGREDDLFFIVFIKPNVKDPKRLSYQTTHTVNPCTEGTEEEIATMGLSLMPDMGEGGGSNQSFADNAQVLIRSLTAALVDLRDNGHISLSWDVFREHITLPKVLELAEDKRIGRTAQNKIRRFAHGVAGVDPSKGPDKQEQMAFQQFGFIASYTLSGLSKLTDDYDYIYGAKYGDISYKDAVFRGRCVASFIPAMKNTPEEIKMLGKLDLVGKRAALAEGLPDRLEGTARSALKRRLYTAKIVPNLSITDEYQEIQVEGNSVSVKQGRSLGYSVWVGLQNYSGLGSEEETNNYDENTDVKAVGRNQGSETIEAILKSLSKVRVLQSEGRTTENAAFGAKDKRTAAYHEVDRIDKEDITSQQPGEFHIIYEGRVMRLEAPYIESIFDRQDWEFPEQAAMVLNTSIELEPLNIADIAAQDIAATVYAKYVSGETKVACQINSGNRNIAEKLGNTHANYLRVIETIMVDTVVIEGEDEWLKSSREQVTPATPQHAPTAENVPGTKDSALNGEGLKGFVADLESGNAPPAATKLSDVVDRATNERKNENIAADAAARASSTKVLDDILKGNSATHTKNQDWDRTEEQRLRKGIVEEEDRTSRKQAQLSIFDESEILKKADAAAEQFKQSVPDEDPIDAMYSHSSTLSGEIRLQARHAILSAAQMMGLEATSVDPDTLKAIQEVLESRMVKDPMEHRDKVIAHELKRLGLYDD